MLKKLIIFLISTCMLLTAVDVEAKRKKRRRRKPKTTFKVKSSGEVRMESRFFSKDSKAYTKDTNFGLFTRLKVKSKHHRNWKENIRIVTRADKNDPSRAVFFFEDAYVQYEKGDFEFSFGPQMLNWSATEAFHPADIINSRNFDSNLENAEKIGEPMLKASYIGDESKHSLMIMPMLTKPILPSITNRLSLSGGVPMLEPLFIEKSGETSESEFYLQYGLRSEFTFDDFDLTFHFVDHLDRTTPLIVVTGFGVQPLYLPVLQLGSTFQWVAEEWVYKVELAHRQFKALTHSTYGNLEVPDNTQLAFGIEYGWATSGGSDIVFILEGQSIFGPDEDERAAMSIFQKDLLFGTRYAFNDSKGQEIFASIILDMERSSETLLNLDYKRRITGKWSMNSGLRIIDAPQKEAAPVGLELLDGANQIYFNLTRYF